MLLLDSNYAPLSGGDWGWGLVLLLILLYGAFRGWKNGLIKEIVSFFGIFVGFYLAYHFYKQSEVGVLGFLLIWICVPLVLGIVAWLITKVLDNIIVLGTMNKLFGAVAGFLKFAFLIGCVILAIDYVREAKHKLEENPVMKVLEAVPNALFPMKEPPSDSSPTPPDEGEEHIQE